MVFIGRLFPTWRTSTSLDKYCQTSFGWILQFFGRIFKPAIDRVPESRVVTNKILDKIPEMNVTQIARLSAQASSRTPMIKFLGPRSPQPHFDRSKLPPIQKSNIVSASSQSKPSSIGKIGTTPRGSGIDESQLPLRFHRRLIDEEEINAINNGSAYGL